MSNHLANLFDYGGRAPTTNSTMSPGGNGSSNGFGNGPGPIGPNGGLNNGSGGGTSSNGLFNGMGSFLNRSDLCYQSTSTLIHNLNQCKHWIDMINKAINSSSNRESPYFPCLLCKNKGENVTLQFKNNGVS
jgi:hypothetical protein